MKPLEELISPATGWYTPEIPLRLDSGIQLSGIRVAYRHWGVLNSSGDNAVLVCHALTGSADVDSWWPDLLGPGRALDPMKDYILCSNLLGGCYGTTGPSSPDPENGRRWGNRFPPVSVRDMVRLQKMLAEHLGVRRWRMVIGGSLGGMQVLEWGAGYPDWVESMVPIATAVRQPPWAIGFSSVQRQAIEADRNWLGGDYPSGQGPRAGLATAREIAMLSYRHWEGFEQRFGRARHAIHEYEAVSYLNHQGSRFIDRFDAASYVLLTRAMDDFDLAAGRGDHPGKLLGGIRIPALVVSIDSDLLYPPQEQTFLARNLPLAEHVVLRSLHGHDGFLIETERLNAYVCDFRGRLETSSVRVCCG